MITSFDDDAIRFYIKRAAKYGFIVVICLLILEVWMANRLTTYGNEIERLKNIKKIYLTENQILENQIAIASSLLILKNEAQTLGFVPIKYVEYLKDEEKFITADHQ